MRKKIILTAVAAALLVTAAGCGEKKDDVQTSADSRTITYWCEMPSAIASTASSLNDVAMFKALEEKTGIHVEFTHPPVGQTTEQFNLMIASRNFPDVVETYWANSTNVYPGGPGKAIEDNVVIDLVPYLDKAPNYTKWIESNPIYEKGVKTDDGKIYAFMDLNTDVYRGFGGLILRKDWLDELSLEVPKTIEDWETVLRAFKEKKGAAAPLTGDVNKITVRNSFNTAFDIGLGIYVDGDKVKYGPNEAAYKDWLTVMNKWYGEKLIDNDYPTNASDVINAKMTNGESGATLGYIGGSIGTYMNNMKDKDPNYELAAAPYPTTKDGAPARFAEAEADVQQIGAAITVNCKNPEMVVEWLDYLYSDEGYYLTNFGIEGESYNMVDGKPVYTDLIMNNPEGKSMSEMLSTYCRATYPTPGLKQAPEYLHQYYQIDAQKEAMELWTDNIEVKKATKIPNITLTVEESEELAGLSDITTYVEEETQKFIQGVNSMDNYDEFVSTLKSINVDRYIEIYQSAYDRYLKR